MGDLQTSGHGGFSSSALTSLALSRKVSSNFFASDLLVHKDTGSSRDADICVTTQIT